MTTRSDERKYEQLSPFELKNKLIELAGTDADRMMLNAGRGNPNWVALEPRHAFLALGRFALAESERALIRPGFGGAPVGDGIAARYEQFVAAHVDEPGVALLHQGLGYVRDTLRIDPNAFVLEMVDGFLGDHYPTPDRMLSLSEQIVSAYLGQEMCGGSWPDASFQLFATEGGTAAMAYVFNSLMENKLLHKGDTVALGTPIFTPYLEIPDLNDYEFEQLHIREDESNEWRYPRSEIEKLADPKVKAFFVVNPSNPTSRAMHPETIAAIAKLVSTRRKDLILLTDDVYGTFVDGFRSLAAAAPRNTILVYSFSKYFGATGWRLGVIGLHPDNVLDRAIAALPADEQTALTERYHEVFLDPAGTRLIDRMVADSRTVALHHTAGLSTPQQIFMVMLSLHCLVDRAGQYKSAAQDIVARRSQLLYSALGIERQASSFDTHYYTTIDVPAIATQRFGEEFAHYLVSRHEPIDFVWRLAHEKSVVLMDGGGFDAPRMSVRVSLANLDDDAYTAIGTAVSELLTDYHREWQSAQKKA